MKQIKSVFRKNALSLPFFSRLLLTFCLCSMLALLLFLTKYNHPHTDNYVVMINVKKYGFDGYAQFIYQKWSGRFLSDYLLRIEAYQQFLISHYWVHTTFLLLLNTISCIVLFFTINKYLANFTSKNSIVILLALCYMAVQITSLPEISSAYYWLSSGVTYQPSIILIQFELALLIVFYKTQNILGKWLCALLIAVSIVLINFNNELSVLINGSLLAIVFVATARVQNLPFIILAILVYAISMYLTISAPGNYLRSAHIPKAGFAKAIATSLARTSFATWIILKNPMVLCGLLAAFFSGSYFVVNSHAFKLKSIFTNNIWAIWLFSPVLIILIFIPIMYVSNGSFPERVNNELVQYFIMLLLCAAFFTGNFFRINIQGSKLVLVFTFAFALTLCCNSFYGQLLKSCITGKAHDLVLTQRAQTLQHGANTRQNTVTLLSYDKHLDSLLNTTFKYEKEQLKTMIRQKPSFLYLYDDLTSTESVNVLRVFYGLQEIKVIR